LLKGAVGKIGRVCVLPEARGTGLGAELIRESLEELGRQPGVTMAYLGAQSRATGFYEKLGFAVEGEEFLDAGIPHRHMRRAL
jgi:predicted GNAT family N-acyltransferase